MSCDRSCVEFCVSCINTVVGVVIVLYLLLLFDGFCDSVKFLNLAAIVLHRNKYTGIINTVFRSMSSLGLSTRTSIPRQTSRESRDTGS